MSTPSILKGELLINPRDNNSGGNLVVAGNASVQSLLVDGKNVPTLDSGGLLDVSCLPTADSSHPGIVSAGNGITIDASGEISLTVPASSKADKVVAATNGNLASLDSNGNLTDSGVSAASFPHLDQNGKLPNSYLQDGILWADVLVSGGTPSIVLTDHNRYFCGMVISLSIDSSTFAGNAELKFLTGTSAPTIDGAESIKLTGDHCVNNRLIPRSLTEYYIRFLKDGTSTIGYVMAFDSLTPVSVSGISGSIELEDGKRFVIERNVNSFSLQIDSSLFTSGRSQVTFTNVSGVTIISTDVTFTGIDCSGGTFTPVVGRSYLLTFTVVQGSIQCAIQIDQEHITPILFVTAPTGAEVTIRKGETTLTSKSVDRVATFLLPTYGDWIVSGRLAGQDADNTITLSAMKNEIYRAKLQWTGIVLYGVRHYVNESSPQLERLEDAVGFQFTPETENVLGESDFDDKPIFDAIRTCDVDLVNGKITVTAYEGESGFTRTPATGDVCVEIPLFYYKRDGSHLADATPYEDLYISNAPIEGFAPSPAHMDRGDGEGIRSKIYVGVYETDPDFRSISGVSPKIMTQASAFRAGYQARGSQYWPEDILTRSTLEILYKTMVANLNSQTAVGEGIVSSTTANATGSTDTLTYHSGSTTGVRFLGIENLWGNLYEMIDGIKIDQTDIDHRHIYISVKPSDWNNDETTTGYQRIAYDIVPSTGYVTKMGFDANYPWLSLPTAVNGSSSTYYADQIGVSSVAEMKLALMGGTWSSGTVNGLFCVAISGKMTHANSYSGSRLLILP